jgi:Mycobacterium membrane protein
MEAPMTVTEPRTEPLATQVESSGQGAKPRRYRQQSALARFRTRVWRFLNRFWLVLVILGVVAVSGFCVYRLHGIFGVHGNAFGGGAVAEEIKPFNPKVLKLEVWGPPGSVATINYLDKDSKPQQVRDADIGGPLPWSLELKTTQPSLPANLVAQGSGDWIACKITLDDNDGRGPVLKAENRSPTNETVHAFTYCLNKSA